MSAPKSYSVKVTQRGECDVSPSVAVFTIDESNALAIAKLAGVVESNGLLRAQLFDYGVTFLQEDPMTAPTETALLAEDNLVSVECECLVVEGKTFFYTADIKHTDVVVSSEPQAISDLMAHFGLTWPEDAKSVAVKADPDGAALFFAELLGSVESLGALAETHGLGTLTDLLYLQNAILIGDVIDVWPGETQVGSALEKLPSAARWLAYSQLGGEWKAACEKVHAPNANASKSA